MRYLAIFKDSFRETLDCKTFWVLLSVSLLIVVGCWSLSFTPLSPEESLGDIARKFSIVMVFRPGGVLHATYPVEFRTVDPRAGEDGMYALDLRVSPVKEFHRLARHWDALARGKVKKQGEAVPDLDEPADFELERRFLLSRFREQQLTRVEAEALPGGEDFRLYRVQFKPSRPELLHGAHRMGIAFGAWSFRLPSSVAMVVAGIESTLASVIAGLAGVIFALVVTASFIPDMLQKGRIDILLSKPIRRPTLLVYKYLGGLLYVFLNAAFLVGGCWLALAVRSRHWDPSFLWTVPILTAAFAILYSFSSWLGVLTRSPIVCILGSLGLWFVSSMAGQVRRFFSHPLTPMEIPGWVRKSLDAVYYVLPKTSDLGQINSVLIHRGNMGSDGDAILEQVGMMSLDWPMILGSSVGFVAFFLFLACLSFSKRDY